MRKKTEMMGNPNTQQKKHSLEFAASKLSLESEYRFIIQNEVITRTKCNFKEAQIITESILDNVNESRVYQGITNVRIHIFNLIHLEVKKLKTSMSKNFGLTSTQFDHLVKMLQSGDHTLFKATFLAHFDDCIKFLCKKFNASYDDAYDISMDTLIMFRSRLVEGKVKYGNVRFLFTQMAVQHYQRKVKQIYQVDPADLDIPVEEEKIDDDSLAILKQSWMLLGEGCQELLKKVFYGQMKLKDIALEGQKSSVAIRKQKERCVSKLKNYFQKISKSY